MIRTIFICSIALFLSCTKESESVVLTSNNQGQDSVLLEWTRTKYIEKPNDDRYFAIEKKFDPNGIEIGYRQYEVLNGNEHEWHHRKSYSYDKNGNVLYYVINAETYSKEYSFVYDHFDSVITQVVVDANRWSTKTTHWRYDGYHVFYEYQDGNWLEKNFKYDADGNIIKKEGYYNLTDYSYSIYLKYEDNKLISERKEYKNGDKEEKKWTFDANGRLQNYSELENDYLKREFKNYIYDEEGKLLSYERYNSSDVLVETYRFEVEEIYTYTY